MPFNFNWIDILMACIIGRVIYTGMKSNVVIEVFRLMGTLCAIFISLHYYVRLGAFLGDELFAPEPIQATAAFILLWLTVTVVFKFIGDGWSMMLKIEANPIINKWGSLIISSVRSIVVCSLMIMLFMTMGNSYLGRSVHHSFSGHYLIDFSPKIYKFSFDAVVGKFFPRETINIEAFKLKDVGKPKDRKKKK